MLLTVKNKKRKTLAYARSNIFVSHLHVHSYNFHSTNSSASDKNITGILIIPNIKPSRVHLQLHLFINCINCTQHP